MRRALPAALLAALAGCGSLTPPPAPVTPTSITLAIPPTATPAPLPRTRGPLPAIPADDPRAMGRADAPVTLIEYSDFECPFCLQHSGAPLARLKAEFVDSGQVRYVFRNYIEVAEHRSAGAAAIASMCAAEQDQFWPMHDLLFATQRQWSPQPENAVNLFVGYAEQLGLGVPAFINCLQDPAIVAQIQAELQEARELGARGTPSFFANDVYIQGVVSVERFAAAFDQARSVK